MWENCVGLGWKEVGAYKRKGNRLRSAINVSKCSHNVTGALLGCRFHNPKVGSSILPPATNYLLSLNNLQRLASSDSNLDVSNLCPEQTALNRKETVTDGKGR